MDYIHSNNKRIVWLSLLIPPYSQPSPIKVRYQCPRCYGHGSYNEGTNIVSFRIDSSILDSRYNRSRCYNSMLMSFQNNNCHSNSTCKKVKNSYLLNLLDLLQKNRCEYIVNTRWNYTLHPRFRAQILHLSFFFLMKGNNLPCCRNYHSSFLLNINRWC